MTVDAFLAAIAAGAEIDAGDVAVIVAHPDDETAGCGLLLGRLRGVHVVVATDGTPRDHAGGKGHTTAESYARVRERELHRALALAGVDGSRLTLLGFPDQGTVPRLPALVGAIRRFVDQHGIRHILTHAYEGGHPDHDAVAFAAASAGVPVIEMPFYRQQGDGLVFQSFVPDPSRSEIIVAADRAGREHKQRLIEVYASQAEILGRFPLDTERFRIAPGYDFLAPSNAGQVFYESQPWGVTRGDWHAAVSRVLAERT
jgi:N-acetylglucosamine malate deacetylase 2